ncbi:MAG: bifunctional pyr operon transcriptional regulator/uracil phosphoribosyltransferase PyrR [Pseudomonadota bacterium]
MQLDAEKLIELLAEKVDTLSALAPNTAIVGIHTGGAWVAERLVARLGPPLKASPCGTLAVTLHRDDFARRGLHPQKKSTDIPFTVDGRHILLVDDVLQSGRTIRAALNELFDFGRPASVKLAVLIDRGGRELPMQADFVALSMPLDAQQSLELTNENDVLRFEIREAKK